MRAQRSNPFFLFWCFMDCFASLAMTARLDGLLRGACHRAHVRATERVGWVEPERYPSIASCGDDGFRRLNPSYVLNVYWRFVASVYAKMDRVDNKTGSSDLPVGRFVDGAVESFFSDFPKNTCSHPTQIKSRTLAIPSHRGAYPDRQRRGMGCGGRGSVRRAT